jgi:hypothetical protein
MSQCNRQLHLPFLKQRDLTVTFCGGELVTDAGLLLIRQFEAEGDLIGRLAHTLSDRRNPVTLTHSNVDLLRQRLYQIIAGYEDCNDATRLRRDPLFKATVGRLPTDRPLASQPTLSRFENGIATFTCREFSAAMVDWFVTSRAELPPVLTLDLDTSDAPTYGQQPLAFFHGHYNTHMYFPMFLSEATTGFLLWSELRPGNAGPSDGATNILDDVVCRLRAARRDVHLMLRADAHFATPLILEWLEDQGIGYTIGLPPNGVLEALSASFVQSVRDRFARSNQLQRAFTSFEYRTQKTWSRARRVIVKVEVTPLGTNVRYVVTNRGGRSKDLYEWYVQRGGTIESSLKQLKNGFHGDRMSCHTFEANRFRLLLHAAAFNLLALFRQRITVPELRTADIHSLRVKLIKVAARVRLTVRRLWFDLSSSWPFARLFRLAHLQLVAPPSG